MGLSSKNITPFIHPEKTWSKWIGYAGLTIGILLLLVSVQMFLNIRVLLKEEAPRKSGAFDYVSISKVITNQNMGSDNRFSPNDIQLLKNQPEITGVAPLYSNQFRATASAGNILPFSTDLFLESINPAFLDTLPKDFQWQPGKVDVPVIFSSEFLEMYNVFAPSQGLPQLSPRTISSVNIFLQCSGTRGSQNFRASIIGLTDRVNSILVPQSFLQWANQEFSGDSSTLVSRVYLKTVDANNPVLLKFLDDHGYYINKDKVRFGRIKGLLQNITGAIASLGVLMIILALIFFGFYLRLKIARSRENIKLLIALGYSPGWLSGVFSKSFLPVYLALILICLGITEVFQFLFSHLSFAQETVGPYIHWIVLATAGVLLIVTMLINRIMVRSEIRQL